MQTAFGKDRLRCSAQGHIHSSKKELAYRQRFTDYFLPDDIVVDHETAWKPTEVGFTEARKYLLEM